MNASQISQLLGLPDPAHCKTRSESLTQAYKLFCANLLTSDNECVIWADGELLDFQTQDHFPESQHGLLRLLAAMWYPDNCQINEIRDRLSNFIDFERTLGKFSGHTYGIEVLQAFMMFRDQIVTGQAPCLTKGRKRGTELFAASATLSTGPGSDWKSRMSVSRFNKDWAIVLFWGDAEDQQSQAFPTILGFARTEPLGRNVGRLLAGQSLYQQCASSALNYDTAYDLPVACWLKGDDGEVSFAPSFLLDLDDRELDYLRSRYYNLTDPAIFKQLEEIVFEGDLEVKDILERYGRPKDGNYLDSILHDVRKRNEL